MPETSPKKKIVEPVKKDTGKNVRDTKEILKKIDMTKVGGKKGRVGTCGSY